MIAGLLLAAGKGRRFGRPKALVDFDGRLLVERGVALLRTGGCAPAAVVLGASYEEVLAAADLSGALVVRNEDWPTGMGSSLRAGLAALPADADAAVIALVDQPMVSPEAVRRLIEAHADGATVAVATYHGARRNPVLLARSVWAAAAEAAEGDVGARAFLEEHPDLVVKVSCDDVGSPHDIDTIDDLAALPDCLRPAAREHPSRHRL